MAKGYSLHLGLNYVDPAHYNGWDGELRACEFDANDMAAIAQALGYVETTVLLTKEATSGRLISKMLHLARTLEPGDLLFVSYSGHGGQIPDEAGEEDDRFDETWCLYDRQLIDDEIYRLLGQFKAGVRILTLHQPRIHATLPLYRSAGAPDIRPPAGPLSQPAGRWARPAEAGT